MSDFTFHDVDTAPEAAKPGLKAAQEQMGGKLPNLYRYMAESPELLEGYQQLRRLAGETSFSPIEQEIVQLAASFDNECTYCMAAHSMRADKLGLDGDGLAALRGGEPISDPKLEALRRFTHKIVRQRGHLNDADIQAFLEAGYTRQNVLEVILIVGAKTLSNYANHVFATPLNDFLEPYKWEKP